jgi:hypothetical protein
MAFYLLHPTSCYACGEPGKEGIGSILGVVNTYYPATTSVSGNATLITLGPSVGHTSTIQPRDLLLIIQMQDGGINSSNSDAYGNGIGGDIPYPPAINPGVNNASGLISPMNAGLYEFGVAANAVGTGGGVLSLTRPLTHSYTNAGATSKDGQKKFQVVRVPQYSSATLVGAVRAVPWNGATGGIVALDVAGHLNFGGQLIDVSGQGFRGGYGYGTGYNNPTQFAFVSTGGADGFKGEGIAGTPTEMWNGVSVVRGGSGYPIGSRGMGAPGNAGGGGAADTGGGGGANYGAGGRGGDEYCPQKVCLFTLDSSKVHTVGALGGLGGLIPTGTLSVTRLMMGGGGGGGADHKNQSGHGGLGGGIVIIRTGASSGSGRINAMGGAAPNPTGTGNAGGGGAGGTVFIASRSSLNGLTLNTNGGTGGNVTNHAPGGGGGGGAVYQSGGAMVVTSGGANGTRSVKAPLGNVNATPGMPGISGFAHPTDPQGSVGGSDCLPILTVVKTTPADTSALPKGTPTVDYSVTLSNLAGRGTATGVSLADDLPNPFTYNGNSISPVYTGGASGPASLLSFRVDPVIFGVAGGNLINSFIIPGGGSVLLPFTVNLNGATGTFQNPANVHFLDSTRIAPGQTVTPGGLYTSGVLVAGSNYDKDGSANDDVTIVGPLALTIVRKSTVYSDPFNGTSNPKSIPGAMIHYTLTVANAGQGAVDKDKVVIIDPIPVHNDFYLNDIGGIGGGAVTFTPLSSGLVYKFISLGSTTDDVDFSNDGGVSFNYTPVPDGTGFDSAVTHVRINPKGAFNGLSTFELKYRVRVE